MSLGIPVHGFLVKHPGGAGLVDTGYGTLLELIKDYRPVNASVAEALHKHDVDPSDIRWIINSHLHFDHCGQNAVFPQAPLYVQRAEYERRHRYADTPKAWLDYAGARYELLDGEREIVPGVQVLTTPGHTPGHQSIEVETTTGPSLLTGDACWTVRMFDGEAPRGGMMKTMQPSANRWRKCAGSSRPPCTSATTTEPGIGRRSVSGSCRNLERSADDLRTSGTA